MKVQLNLSHVIRAAVLFAGTAVFSVNALAQQYPSRPIRLIVPFPPGGNSDVVTRLVAAELAKRLGQPLVVDNKPGASEIIGTDALAKAAPDGYTLGLLTTSHAINPMLFRRLPYDSRNDVELVSWMVTVPLVLAVNSQLNINSVPELIAYAKANPGKLNYASTGPGSVHHILVEWICALAGVEMNHVPYKGVAPAMKDLLGGQVQLMFSGVTTLAEHTRSGRLVALATTSPVPIDAMPQIGPLSRYVPKFKVTNLGYGIGVPAKTPRHIVLRLNEEMRAVLSMPEVRARLDGMGAVAQPSTLLEGTTLISREVLQWEKIIKEAGVKLDLSN